MIIDILSNCTDPEKDPELRFDMLSLLDLIIETPSIEESLEKNAKEIGQVVLHY